MATPAYKAKIRYLTYENRVIAEESKFKYYPVDIYRSGSVNSEKMSCYEYLQRCLCCAKNFDELSANNSTSALVRHSDKSYNVNSNTSTSNIVHQEQGVPTLTVTRVVDEELTSIVPRTEVTVAPVAPDNIDTELYKSTTQLLLATEKRASSISLSYKYPIKNEKNQVSNQCDPIDEVDINVPLKYGEKNSFIREVLSCRDTFLKSLEWCDNSLTRRKRYRNIKRDDWIELKGHGSK